MAGALTGNRLPLPGIKTVAELAEARGVRECIQWFSRERSWINEQHLQLCRIPAPTFLEEERAGWMAEQFRALGCQVRLDRAGNVIAQLDGDGESPYVALTAHLDTVLAPRRPEDISVGSDGRFQGPGVSDNGAGLAALLATAAAMKASLSIQRSPILFIANVCEEGEGNLNGMRHLCRQSALGQRIGCYLVLDGPSTDHITCQALASRRFDATFSGPGGHSWSDYGVGNPVLALSRAMVLFAENPPNGSAGPRSSFNVGIMEGGTSVNAIPSSARAKVDLRSESVTRLEEMAALLTLSVERALEMENERSSGPKLTARIREIGSRPGGRLREDSMLLAYIRAVDGHLGIRSHLDCASTDANIPLSMGLDALSIGAGGQGGGAHTPGEWYHPAGRELGLQRILLTLCLAMREGPANPRAVDGLA